MLMVSDAHGDDEDDDNADLDDVEFEVDRADDGAGAPRWC